jgi:hypothetical protein
VCSLVPALRGYQSTLTEREPGAVPRGRTLALQHVHYQKSLEAFRGCLESVCGRSEALQLSRPYHKALCLGRPARPAVRSGRTATALRPSILDL